MAVKKPPKKNLGKKIVNLREITPSLLAGMVLAYILAAIGLVPSSIELGLFGFDLPLVSRAQYRELESENSYLLSLVPEPLLETEPLLNAVDPNVLYNDQLHGVEIFQDVFDNNRNSWRIEARQTELVLWNEEITNGKLRMDLNFLADAAASVRVPVSNIKNFVLSVDATIEDASFDDPTIVEIKFRIDETGNYYSIRFSNNSTYSVRRCEIENDECQWREIINFIPTEYINVELGETNSFAIVILGSTFSLYSNGQRLATIQDVALTGPGGISLGVWGMRGNTAIVEFDNLTISDTSLIEGN